MKKQLEGNINKLRKYGYVALGIVMFTLDVFTVLKVDDVRQVYNGSGNSSNETIWAPWFRLPTVQSELREIKSGTFM